MGWSLVVGLILLALLYKIPILGWFIYLAAWSVGIGAMSMLLFRKRKNAVVSNSTGAAPIVPS
jgi:hypothetical protein